MSCIDVDFGRFHIVSYTNKNIIITATLYWGGARVRCLIPVI